MNIFSALGVLSLADFEQFRFAVDNVAQSRFDADLEHVLVESVLLRLYRDGLSEGWLQLPEGWLDRWYSTKRTHTPSPPGDLGMLGNPALTIPR